MGNILMDKLFNNIKKIITTIEVKKEYIANEFETIDTIQSYNKYYIAYLEADKFEFYDYDETILRLCITDLNESDLNKYLENKFNIPIQYRNILLETKRKQMVDNYIEKNNYYRTLLGLPNNTSEIVLYNGTPIHLFSNDDIEVLKNEGVMDKLILENKDKKYLKFIKNRLDLNIIRQTDKYSLLYFEPTDDDSLNRTFTKVYNECRVYICSQFYNEQLSYNSPEYYGFIGLSILFMTINRLISEYYKIIARRDFYDRNLIKLLFDSYGVIYYDEIPIKYQRLIMKNLNSLLKYSGIDKIYVSIHELFAFNNVQMFKYYLSRSHKFDANGFPIHKEKEIINEEGEKLLVDDVENMYDLYFIKVPIDCKDTDFNQNLNTIENTVRYEDIVDQDPYWGNGYDNNDFKKLILEKDFNIRETKYVGMDARYMVDKMNFEINYFMQMVKDLKPLIKGINIRLDNIINGDINLFETITMVLHLICFKFKSEGKIRNTVTQNLSVLYGFNFKDNLEYINSLIPEDFKYEFEIPVNNLNVKSLSDLFTNNKEFYYYLVDRMYKTKDKKEYDILNKIYHCSCVKYDDDSCYFIDGKIPDTYIEYLRLSNPKVYSYIVNNITEKNVDNIIEYILSTLDDVFIETNIEYLFTNLPNITVDTIKTYMHKIISFFMSYKADLRFFSTSYVIEDRALNLIKILDQFNIVGSNLLLKDELNIDELSDYMRNILSQIEYIENLNMSTDIDMIIQLLQSTFIIITDDILVKSKLSLLDMIKSFNLNDFTDRIKSIMKIKDEIVFKGEISHTHNNIIIMIRDLIKTRINLLTYFFIKNDLNIEDNVDTINIKNIHNIDLSIFEQINYISKLYSKLYINIKDNILLYQELDINDNIIIDDGLNKMRSVINNDSVMSMDDKIKYMINLYIDNYLKYKDNINIKNVFHLKENTINSFIFDDIIDNIKSIIDINEDFKVKYKIDLISLIKDNDIIKYYDNIFLYNQLSMKNNIIIDDDICNLISMINNNSDIDINDKIKTIIDLYLNNYLKYNDNISINNILNAGNSNSLILDDIIDTLKLKIDNTENITLNNKIDLLTTLKNISFYDHKDKSFIISNIINKSSNYLDSYIGEITNIIKSDNKLMFLDRGKILLSLNINNVNKLSYINIFNILIRKYIYVNLFDSIDNYISSSIISSDNKFIVKSDIKKKIKHHNNIISLSDKISIKYNKEEENNG